MRLWWISAVTLLAAFLAACGGGATPITIAVTSPGAGLGATATVNLGGTVQYSAAVSGGPSVTNVFWQICLPPSVSTAQPTNCTQGVGPTVCKPPAVAKPLVGYGIIDASGLYTAPTNVVPNPDTFEAVAVSCVSSTTFGGQSTQIVSGIKVQIIPSTVTIGTGESYLLDLQVTGTQDTAVTWETISSGIPPIIVAGGNSTYGFICPNPTAPQPCPNGEYVAPLLPPPGGPVTVKATSAVDTTQSASTTITVDNAVDPTMTSIDPLVTGQGSAQQDVYISGSNFFTTSQVLAGTNLDPVPTTFINTSLLRATVPAADLTGNLGPAVPIQVQRQNGDFSLGGPINLALTALRPAVVSSTLDSIAQSAPSAGVTLTGGYFSPGTTTATFNGQSVTTSFTDSRHLALTIPFNTEPAPGLYPIVVQNAGVAAPSGLNLAVEPTAVPTLPNTVIPVGAGPSAIAIDNALHLAVVTNQSAGTISLINLGTNAVVNTIAIPVINGGTSVPTSVAIDDVADNQLTHDLALVVNNGDNSVGVIDLVTQTVLPSINLTPFTPTGSAPVSIGINPLSHRAIVANQSTNVATIIDLVTPNPNLATPCTTPPCVVTTIGGNLPPFFSTGANPAIIVDPRVNWAVVTPGGAGTVNIVDLGRNAGAGDGGRQPLAMGSLTLTTTIQGVGINTETHDVLLTDPKATTPTTYSLLDNSVNSISFTNNGAPFSETGFVAAAVNSLDNVGVIVNEVAGTATVADLETGNVLAADISVGNSPQAVAIDQGTNRAVIVNNADNTVALLTLGSGTAIRTPQIIEASPPITFAQTVNPLTLTINGAGFAAGASVLLDGTALTGNNIVKVTPNQIVATVPAAMLGLAHRFIVAVQNPGQLSNLTDLAVIQPVSTGLPGSAPFGVAVDNDLDLAVVTNTGAGDVALVDLVTGTLETPTLASSVTVGTAPQGVAVIPRLGIAVVANNGSNNFTVVDETGMNPSNSGDCNCMGPNGVAVDQDNAIAAVTGSLSNTINFAPVQVAVGAKLGAGTQGTLDQGPGAVAIDPNPNVNLENAIFAAVATVSQASTIDIVNTSGGIAKRLNSLQAPTGVIFDPLNQVFVAANSLQNNLVFVDGTSFNNATAAVGVNPTSLDYNFQTSTLVTVNSASNTMSVLDYTCSPIPVSGQLSPCAAGPRTRLILGLPNSGQFSQLQQFSVAIDLKLNLAVVADQNNDRVLLIPLPH